MKRMNDHIQYEVVKRGEYSLTPYKEVLILLNKQINIKS